MLMVLRNHLSWSGMGKLCDRNVCGGQHLLPAGAAGHRV
jgi:hypothetical protein